MLKITAIIPTFNEQDHILQAIESVSWADEIIVVDSFSTDKTVELASRKKSQNHSSGITNTLPRKKTGLFLKPLMIGFFY